MKNHNKLSEISGNLLATFAAGMVVATTILQIFSGSDTAIRVLLLVGAGLIFIGGFADKIWEKKGKR